MCKRLMRCEKENYANLKMSSSTTLHANDESSLPIDVVCLCVLYNIMTGLMLYIQWKCLWLAKLYAHSPFWRSLLQSHNRLLSTQQRFMENTLQKLPEQLIAFTYPLLSLVNMNVTVGETHIRTRAYIRKSFSHLPPNEVSTWSIGSI